MDRSRHPSAATRQATPPALTLTLTLALTLTLTLTLALTLTLLIGAEALTARPEPPKLTNRERSVLELVAEGKLNREIASEIGITTRVVETYVRRLLAKTGTSNRTQLLRRALQIGLLSPDPPYQYM